MFKLVLEKAEEPEIKLPTSAGSWKKQEEFQKNIYFCFIDYAKDFDCVDHKKLWKILQDRLQKFMNCELLDVHIGFRNGRGFRKRFLKGSGFRKDRSNCQHPLDDQKRKRIPEKHLLLLY